MARDECHSHTLKMFSNIRGVCPGPVIWFKRMDSGPTRSHRYIYNGSGCLHYDLFLHTTRVVLLGPTIGL
jgi:hypothetical protein